MSTASPGVLGGALSPQAAPAPWARRWAAQTSIEWRLLMTNGEQLLLTLVIPVGVLIGITRSGLSDIDEATPGVMALAILATAFTATAISTGFERRSGVLKFLGTTPLARSGLLAGKVLATLGVLLVQLAVIAGAAALLGWSPDLVSPFGFVAAIALGTLALGAWGFALAGLLRAEATLAIANAIFLLLLVAGGTVLPAHRLPSGLDTAAGLLPSAALGDALRASLAQGDAALAPALAVLVGWALVGVVVAARRFRWE